MKEKILMWKNKTSEKIKPTGKSKYTISEYSNTVLVACNSRNSSIKTKRQICQKQICLCDQRQAVICLK